MMKLQAPFKERWWRPKDGILGKHFLSALSSRIRNWYSLPKTKEYHNQYCHSYSRNNDKVGVLNFPHFESREMILFLKKKSHSREHFNRTFLFICFEKRHAMVEDDHPAYDNILIEKHPIDMREICLTKGDMAVTPLLSICLTAYLK